MRHLLILLAGFLLDLVFGDPLWLPHPVQGVGWLINRLEPVSRGLFLKTPRGEWLAGLCMTLSVLLLSVGIAWGVIALGGLVHPCLGCAIEVILAYQMLATKSLRVESMKVYHALQHGTLEESRRAVSWIVGRDTAQLTEEEVALAAVETVAENASDGILAPMLWMAVLGPLGGVFYKAINTMDSMVGYKNERYRHFGTVAARLDDLANWIPARLSGVLMCVAAALPLPYVYRFDAVGALRIFLRDRLNHSSPNSAHTEAACAGALGLQMGGTHSYFGKPVVKPTIGDACRAVEREDIRRANHLVLRTALLALLLFDLLPLLRCIVR